jgi:hypothetical protein
VLVVQPNAGGHWSRRLYNPAPKAMVVQPRPPLAHCVPNWVSSATSSSDCPANRLYNPTWKIHPAAVGEAKTNRAHGENGKGKPPAEVEDQRRACRRCR